MASNMLLLVISMLLIAKVTLEEIDCKLKPFENCKRPKVFKAIPREISDFNDRCVETKSYLRCTKNWQDTCGTQLIVLFQEPDLFEAGYNTVSEICEEGTLLNTVATENLKCFNETFGKTRCSEEAEEFLEPLMKRREDEEYVVEENGYIFISMCLREVHITECVLRALSLNCGKLVEEAMREVIRRIKSLEYSCSVEDAQAVLEKLNNLDLIEDKKESIRLLLDKFVEENSK
ncbi:unnamed protein product [Larinioides sclopetarius]|uniref:DUF19 domain-containing protein n=1 Tax=Larinioides sclopetarius TaxID=280406 RepID=A0AAV2BM49_9ARAC